MRKIEVVEYDPAWPELFARERDLLFHTLRDVAVSVHHIGNTSVPGLAAKPIIDILLEVRALAALDAVSGEMEAIGYRSKGELGIPGRRYFQKGGDERTHHVHAFESGDANLRRHLAFRDYLRMNPVVAAEYGELKKRIAQACEHDSARYCDGKDAFVKHHEALALKHNTPT